jgi:hypothetical protein
MKLLMLQFSPVSRHFLPIRPPIFSSAPPQQHSLPPDPHLIFRAALHKQLLAGTLRRYTQGQNYRHTQIRKLLLQCAVLRGLLGDVTKHLSCNWAVHICGDEKNRQGAADIAPVTFQQLPAPSTTVVTLYSTMVTGHTAVLTVRMLPCQPQSIYVLTVLILAAINFWIQH